jgi:ubiquinone/menaquinone biosynthesis C-methylase UbiE
VTSAADEKYRILDSYWRDSRLYSLAAENAEVEAALDSHWNQVGIALPEQAAVLDIACGNGAAALAVARAGHQVGKALSITGIDAAAIDPIRYAIRHGELLRTIAFHGNTLMEEMPFAAESFDAVISQFGFEYGDLAKAASEAARVLKPKGLLSILAMPASSSALELAKTKMKQSQHVLTQTKLFDVALAVAQALHHVESTGEGRDTKQYLERFSGEIERTMARFAKTESDTVIAVIIALQRIITERRSIDIAHQIAAINQLKKRVTDHVARTEAMMRSALGDAGMAGLKRRLTEAGIDLSESKPISVSNHGTVASDPPRRA